MRTKLLSISLRTPLTNKTKKLYAKYNKHQAARMVSVCVFVCAWCGVCMAHSRAYFLFSSYSKYIPAQSINPCKTPGIMGPWLVICVHTERNIHGKIYIVCSRVRISAASFRFSGFPPHFVCECAARSTRQYSGCLWWRPCTRVFARG